MCGERLAEFYAAHTVAVFIKSRRKTAKPKLRRKCCHYAASNSTFCRHANAINPFASIIVHAGTGHDRKCARHRIRLHHLLACKRIKIACADEKRALSEIHV